MKVRHLMLALAAALIASTLVLSCTQPTGTTVTTIQFKNDTSGNVQFETNDSKHYSMAYTYVYPTSAGGAPYTDSISLKKMSGASSQGMGMVVDYVNSSNFTVIEIDTSGDWAVLQDVAGTFSNLTATGTNPNPDLQTGYGVMNKISAARSGDNYTVSFNGGSNQVTFTDAANAAGTTAGFLATVGSSSKENFPTVPEDIRYRMTSPITAP